MEDEKRKRTRKRPRRSKKADDATSDQDVAQNGSKSNAEQAPQPAMHDKNGGGSASVHPQTAAPSGSQAGKSSVPGPTITFYERTNPHKPSALSTLDGGAPRGYTISVALPGSIILNAQTPELQCRLAGQIARSCAIFNVDEIVVFDEGGQGDAGRGHEDGYGAQGQRWTDGRGSKKRWNGEQEEIEEQADGQSKHSSFDPNGFLARILQYVETPQYLRKSLFPMHRDLRLAGLLAPLDCPHHLRLEDQSPYREGVCVEAPHWSKDRSLCYVYTGLRDPVGCAFAGKGGTAINRVPLGARVTVRMPKGKEVGQLVSPREPVEQRGLYWGYTVRLCGSLSEVISGSSWSDPYDLVIGTSERGQSLTDVIEHARSDGRDSDAEGGLPSTFKHALIVFGGLSGLEVAVERDAGINATADEANQLFDTWINVVEGQGSRTIRTEEALLITLSRLKTVLESIGAR